MTVQRSRGRGAAEFPAPCRGVLHGTALPAIRGRLLYAAAVQPSRTGRRNTARQTLVVAALLFATVVAACDSGNAQPPANGATNASGQPAGGGAVVGAPTPAISDASSGGAATSAPSETGPGPG